MKLGNLVLTALGLTCFGLAMIGVIVPGLPTTPFLLLASVLFCRSHPGLYRWLISHPRGGEGIRRFNEQRVIPPAAKLAAVVMMTLMILLSVLLFIETFWIKLLVAAVGAIGIATVLSFRSRPTP